MKIIVLHFFMSFSVQGSPEETLWIRCWSFATLGIASGSHHLTNLIKIDTRSSLCCPSVSVMSYQQSLPNRTFKASIQKEK